MLNDEDSKRSRYFSKSVETFRKQNNDDENSNKTAKIIIPINSCETQTEGSLESSTSSEKIVDLNNLLKRKLINVKFLLDDPDNYQNSSNYSSEFVSSHLTLEKVLCDVENLANKNRQEVKDLKQFTEQLKLDLNEAKDSKMKLESLYKIKCKADLNKCAEIKKLELKYESELMKFRNEFNMDLVRYLENQISLKNNQLNDQLTKLNNFAKCVQNFKSSSAAQSQPQLTNNQCCMNSLNKLKDYLLNELSSHFESLSNSALNSNGSISKELTTFTHAVSKKSLDSLFSNSNISEKPSLLFKKSPVKIVSIF
jgi:hypothetical protein